MKVSRAQKGFTLIEILLVVAAIAILAGIVIVAINPAKQLAATRDAERNSEVNTILNAVSQSIVAGVTTATAAIPVATCDTAVAAQEICDAAVVAGECAVDLSSLVPDYVAALPSDPTTGTDGGTGYFIAKTAAGRVTVCGTPETAGATLSVTR